MSEPVFKLSHVQGVPVSDSELIADLRRVARELKTDQVTIALYGLHGRYDESTPRLRFGSWNQALLRAGLRISNRVDISDEELFENVLALWQHHGRQPRRSELYVPPSTISAGPYKRRFRSWMNALRAFVDYANGTGAELAERQVETGAESWRKTGRDPSLRLRWHVLQRDNFRC